MSGEVLDDGRDESFDEICAGCGIESDLWRKSVTRDGESYCCERCAEGQECGCETSSVRALPTGV